MVRKSRKKRRRLVEAEDLLRLRIPSHPRLSRDGSSIVYVEKTVGPRNEYESRLWLVDVDTRETTLFTQGPRDRAPAWSPDGERVAFLRKSETDSQVHVIAVGGGEARALTRFPEGSFGDLRWSPDGKLIAVSFREEDPEWTEEARRQREEDHLSDPPRVLDDAWYRLDGDGYFSAQRHRLYVIDVATGEHRCCYAKDTLGSFTFDFSPTSRELVVSTNRDRRAQARPWKDELLRIDVRTGKISPIPNLPRGPKTSVRWSPDGKSIAYVGREGEDGIYSVENTELFVCDPRRGGARSLTAKTDHCLLSVAIGDTADALFSPSLEFSGDGSRLYYRLGIHGTVQIATVSVRGGKVEVATSGKRDLELGNVSADGKKIALLLGSVTRPFEVAVGQVLPRTRQLRTRVLTRRNEALLAELELSEPESHSIATADGTRVQLWVMRPPRVAPGRKTAAILQIHGGPHAQYGSGFFHEFQYLAARGYTVVYSNPRGSKGYGRDHCAAIRGQWGTADWTDVTAVIEFMKEQKNIVPSRLGVMGGSYGGYLTNWAVSHCHDFRAAITDRCVSNLVSMFGNSDYLSVPDLYFPGNAWDRPEALWDQSPLKHFGHVKTPLLIIHSEGDLRCNIEQAEQIFSVLQLRGVPSRFVRYPASTSHGMSRMGPPDLRVHRLQQIATWWKQHLA